MRAFLALCIVFLFLPSCQRIQTGKSLKVSTSKLIKSLGLLADNEQIIKYYSNYTEKTAGNFFTDRRIGHYWLDANDVSKNDTSFAFYENIVAIDTIFTVPDTFSPYMRITRSDSSTFKVFVDGSVEDIKSFFEDAIRVWRSHKP